MLNKVHKNVFSKSSTCERLKSAWKQRVTTFTNSSDTSRRIFSNSNSVLSSNKFFIKILYLFCSLFKKEILFNYFSLQFHFSSFLSKVKICPFYRSAKFQKVSRAEHFKSAFSIGNNQCCGSGFFEYGFVRIQIRSHLIN